MSEAAISTVHSQHCRVGTRASKLGQPKLDNLNWKKIKRNLTRFLTYGVLISLCSGQLGRITLTNRVAIYPHDAMIILCIIIHSKDLLAWWQAKMSRKTKNWVYFLLGWSIFGLTINGKLTAVPLLYLGRLAAYILFWVSVSTSQVFSKKDILAMQYTYLVTLAASGLVQFILWPDATWLENLGWDDHYYRLIGTWWDPAFMGLAYALGVAFFTHNYRNISRKKCGKKLWWLGMGTNLVALILTFSRSGWLAAVIMETMILAKFFVKRRKTCVREKCGNNLLGVAAIISISGGLILGISLLHPSDSTNIWRVNSVRIRAEMLREQVKDLSWRQWLTGRGAFVPLNGEIIPAKSAEIKVSSGKIIPVAPDTKITAAFPDTFILLWISFWGLPVATALLYSLGRQMWRWWQAGDMRAVYVAGILISGLFNQSTLQPFVVMTTIFLTIDKMHNDMV